MDLLMNGTRVDLPKKKLMDLRKQVREDIATDALIMKKMKVELRRERAQRRVEEKKKKKMSAAVSEWKKKHKVTELWKTRQWKQTLESAADQIWVSGCPTLTGVYQLQKKTLRKGRPIWKRLQPISSQVPLVLQGLGSDRWAIYKSESLILATSSSSPNPFGSTWTTSSLPTISLTVSSSPPKSFSENSITLSHFDCLRQSSSFTLLQSVYCGYPLLVTSDDGLLLHAHLTEGGYCWGISRLNDPCGDTILDQLQTPEKSTKTTSISPLSLTRSLDHSDDNNTSSPNDLFACSKGKRVSKSKHRSSSIGLNTTPRKSITLVEDDDICDQVQINDTFTDSSTALHIRTALLQDVPDLVSVPHMGKSASDVSWFLVKAFPFGSFSIPVSDFAVPKAKVNPTASIPLPICVNGDKHKLTSYLSDLAELLENIYEATETTIISELCESLHWPSDCTFAQKSDILSSAFNNTDDMISMLSIADDKDIHNIINSPDDLSDDSTLSKLVYQIKNRGGKDLPWHKSMSALNALVGFGSASAEAAIKEIGKLINWISLSIIMASGLNDPQEFCVYVKDIGTPIGGSLLIPSCSIGFMTPVFKDVCCGVSGGILIKLTSCSYCRLLGRDSALLPPMIVKVNSHEDMIEGVCVKVVSQSFSSRFRKQISNQLERKPTVRFDHPLSGVSGIGPHVVCIEITNDDSLNDRMQRQFINVAKSLSADCSVNVVVFSPFFAVKIWSEWGKPKNLKNIDFTTYKYNMTDPDSYGIMGALSAAYSLSDAKVVHIFASSSLTEWEGKYAEQWLSDKSRLLPICVYSCSCCRFKRIAEVSGGVFLADTATTSGP